MLFWTIIGIIFYTLILLSIARKRCPRCDKWQVLGYEKMYEPTDIVWGGIQTREQVVGERRSCKYCGLRQYKSSIYFGSEWRERMKTPMGYIDDDGIHAYRKDTD